MLIAIAQIDTMAGDVSGSCERIVASAQRAEEAGADLMLVSPLALSGAHAQQEQFVTPYMRDLAHAIAAATDQFGIPTLAPIFVDPHAPDTAELTILGKHRLDVKVCDPAEAPDYGDGIMTLPVAIWRIRYQGLNLGICYSLGDLISEGFEGEDDLDGLICFSCERYGRDRQLLTSVIGLDAFCQRAREHDCPLIAVNGIGCYGYEIFAGGSFAITSQGDLCALGASCEEDLFLVDTRQWLDHEDVEPIDVDVDAKDLCWDVISLGLADYVHKRDRIDVALAIDGTMQSAALATLAVDALGPTHVHALVCGADARLADARTLAANLHLDARECATDGMDDDSAEIAVAFELARLARTTGAIVLLPFDKTHFAIELNEVGVTVDGLCPFGDLYRADLREILLWRNERSQVIPPSTLDAYAVPGVGQVGSEASHAMMVAVDCTLILAVEMGRDLTRLCRESDHPDLVDAVYQCLMDDVHERLAYPATLAVSSRMISEVTWPERHWRDHQRSDEELDAARIEFRKMSLVANQGTSGAPARKEFDPSRLFEMLDKDPELADEFMEQAQNELKDLVSSMMGTLRDVVETSTIINAVEVSDMDELEEPGFWDPYSQN